ncbi:MAG: dienelactone hydrolase family protein [Caulobacteraceae bacterium]
MSGAFITLNSKVDDAEFSAFHVEPKGARKGGVIVLQEMFGVDGYIRHDAERWGSLGFEVLAPSMFDRCEPGFVAEHTPDGLQAGFKYLQATRIEDAIADIATCVDYLAPRGPVFVVGYCYGGSLAYLAACRIEDLAAASSYYGSMVPKHAHEKPRCPVICHFGREDQHIALDSVQAFAAHRPDAPVHLYEAGHGFNNDGAPGHNLAAAKLARQRTLELFDANGAA